MSNAWAVAEAVGEAAARCGVTMALVGPSLARPHGVTVRADGTLFITDSYNDRILKIVR